MSIKIIDNAHADLPQQTITHQKLWFLMIHRLWFEIIHIYVGVVFTDKGKELTSVWFWNLYSYNLFGNVHMS